MGFGKKAPFLLVFLCVWTSENSLGVLRLVGSVETCEALWNPREGQVECTVRQETRLRNPITNKCREQQGGAGKRHGSVGKFKEARGEVHGSDREVQGSEREVQRSKKEVWGSDIAFMTFVCVHSFMPIACVQEKRPF